MKQIISNKVAGWFGGGNKQPEPGNPSPGNPTGTSPQQASDPVEKAVSSLTQVKDSLMKHLMLNHQGDKIYNEAPPQNTPQIQQAKGLIEQAISLLSNEGGYDFDAGDTGSGLLDLTNRNDPMG